MDTQMKKCVMVLDGSLPAGILANTAAILGITLGRELPEVVGQDVIDGTGRRHPGIITFPVPILKGSPAVIKELREKLYGPEFSGLAAVDFTGLAQSCKTYEEYREKMSAAAGDGLQYFGIAICGDKKKVNRLAGSLPLLR